MTNTNPSRPADVPVACSLTAEQYRRRTADTGDVARQALRDRVPIDGGQRLTFAAFGDVEQRLRGFVDAESACCPFLTLELTRADGTLVLDVTGPDDARPIIEELFA